MVTFPMTLMDPNPVFKVTAFFEVEYLKNVVSWGQSYCRTLVGNHRWPVDLCRFQWRWV